MTPHDLDILLKHPETLTPEKASELKELTEQYPYFAPARLLYLRALKMGDSLLYDREVERAALYAGDRRWLYYFVHPDCRAEEERRYVRPSAASGDYFGMLERVEQSGQEETGQSLRVLAERLRQARLDVVSPSVASASEAQGQPVARPVAVEEEEEPSVGGEMWTLENYAGKMRRLMRDGQYAEVLERIKKLNLNNPKKSIYFADQIRFLEKIIANSKK